MKRPVILASASPRRADLLEQADIPFSVIAPDVDEASVFSDMSGDGPADKAVVVARMKARQVAGQLGDGWDRKTPIVACDTIVVDGDEIFGKPRDREDARRMLRQLSGRTHLVISGVCILQATLEETFSSETSVTFWELSDSDIEEYLDTGDPFDKAGAYGIQSYGVVLVKEILGDYSNVVGLPLSRLVREIEAMSGEHDRATNTTDESGGSGESEIS